MITGSVFVGYVVLVASRQVGMMLSVHAFCGTGDENIIPTCREAGN